MYHVLRDSLIGQYKAKDTVYIISTQNYLWISCEKNK